MTTGALFAIATLSHCSTTIAHKQLECAYPKRMLARLSMSAYARMHLQR